MPRNRLEGVGPDIRFFLPVISGVKAPDVPCAFIQQDPPAVEGDIGHGEVAIGDGGGRCRRWRDFPCGLSKLGRLLGALAQFGIVLE